MTDQTPEPPDLTGSWSQAGPRVGEEIRELRKDLNSATKLVISVFGASWIAIAAMYAAGFLYYLPAKVDPISEKASKIESTINELSTRLARIEGKLDVLAQAGSERAKKSNTSASNASREVTTVTLPRGHVTSSGVTLGIKSANKPTPLPQNP
jgi:hypothetical protein